MKKVLLIEDNKDMRENTEEILNLANYRVISASDGKAGINLAMEFQPDIILCDIIMPTLDGYGVLYSMHENDKLKHTPFIFLTAKSQREDIRQGMESGADDYITKPFSATELLGAIESRLKKADNLKDNCKITDKVHSLTNHDANGQELLEKLIDQSNVNRYKRKQRIYLEGNRPVRLLYLLKGKVKAYKTNEEGKELVVDLYNEGDFFGYVPLITNTAYKETTEAMDDCEVAVIPQPEFIGLLSDPVVAKKFMELLAKNISEKEEKLIEIAYNSLRKKVATSLLTLKSKYQLNDENYSIDMSRENLASIAGTAVESLVRTLTDFKNEKLIDIHHDRHIQILNEKSLLDMLN
jgi:CRP/FNR family transcriptional regulator, cyclic AMP receptor protein